jgi:predicted lysophospholipase L1 biosynthesis ABC-type transport system permease subunit
VAVVHLYEYTDIVIVGQLRVWWGAFVVIPLLDQVSCGTSRTSIVPLVAGAMAITVLSVVAMLAQLRRALGVQPSAVLR